ncbi:MAG: hypothetical protein JSR26_05745 [Proteobacteria bacterium]|nr:hypothetical protein [Pseudomonadota bacterium]
MKSAALNTAALPLYALLLLASAVVFADDQICQTIMDANIKSGSDSVNMTTTGYNFAKDTPKLYGFGKHTCTHLRDETLDGQAAAVYREQFQGNTGHTDATIWIAKSTGRLLREEQDGDITGKGKGHISYHWSSKH